MYQLESVTRSELGLLWEQRASLFASETGLAQLLLLLDAWEASHHTTTCHPLKRVEVEVTESRVPAPRLQVMLPGKSHWLHWIER